MPISFRWLRLPANSILQEPNSRTCQAVKLEEATVAYGYRSSIASKKTKFDNVR